MMLVYEIHQLYGATIAGDVTVWGLRPITYEL